MAAAALPTGRFISLEGGEGVGKSTQLRAVAASLRARGLEVAQSGRWANYVRYAYFDAEPLIGVAVEISAIDDGAVLPDPEAWYPGPPEE